MYIIANNEENCWSVCSLHGAFTFAFGSSMFRLTVVSSGCGCGSGSKGNKNRKQISVIYCVCKNKIKTNEVHIYTLVITRCHRLLLVNSGLCLNKN